MGNRTSSRGGMFSIREIEYLESLPAVERVDNGRIRYTDDFKRECMRRYRAGESPLEIFRQAGLDVSLIGYKRIERCIARWKNSARLNAGTQPEETVSSFAVSRHLHWRNPGQAYRLADTAVLGGACDELLNHANTQSKHSNATPRVNEAHAGLNDNAGLSGNQLLKLIIRQQARRIDELERELTHLHKELDARLRVNDDGPNDTVTS